MLPTRSRCRPFSTAVSASSTFRGWWATLWTRCRQQWRGGRPGDRAGHRCAGAGAGGRNLSKGRGVRIVHAGYVARIRSGWTPLGLPAFLFVITLVVFFHELGHFLVARAFKVKVDVFSVGFGREIVGLTDRHGTRWKISWLPIGGYVKFAGDANAASTPDAQAAARMSAAERTQTLVLQAGGPARPGCGGGAVRQFPARHRAADRSVPLCRPCHRAAGDRHRRQGQSRRRRGHPAGRPHHRHRRRRDQRFSSNCPRSSP